MKNSSALLLLVLFGTLISCEDNQLNEGAYIYLESYTDEFVWNFNGFLEVSSDQVKLKVHGLWFPRRAIEQTYFQKEAHVYYEMGTEEEVNIRQLNDSILQIDSKTLTPVQFYKLLEGKGLKDIRLSGKKFFYTIEDTKYSMVFEDSQNATSANPLTGVSAKYKWKLIEVHGNTFLVLSTELYTTYFQIVDLKDGNITMLRFIEKPIKVVFQKQ